MVACAMEGVTSRALALSEITNVDGVSNVIVLVAACDCRCDCVSDGGSGSGSRLLF